MFPGNPYSKPVNVRLDPAAGAPVALTLTEKIAPIAREPDTPWIKRVRIKSKILSDFWGLPMSIGAEVLLPRDFDEHPDVRYPAIYTNGNFGGRSEEHTSELQSLRRISYDVFCLNKK